MVIELAPHRDWMVPAVLACLCCFWPTGIYAIMSASKVITSVYSCLTKENTNCYKPYQIFLTFHQTVVSFEILTLFLYLKGNAAAARGDVEKANRFSRTTRGLVIASLVLGIIVTGMVVTFQLLFWRRYY